MTDTGKPFGNGYLQACIVFAQKQPTDKSWVTFQYGQPAECNAVC